MHKKVARSIILFMQTPADEKDPRLKISVKKLRKGGYKLPSAVKLEQNKVLKRTTNMSASSMDMSSNNSSVIAERQEHQEKSFLAKVEGIEDEDKNSNIVTLDITKENNCMQTKLHQSVEPGDNQTVHARQSNQLERTSATAATLSTPGNEHIIHSNTALTSTSPQCDQNQPNISIGSKVTETIPQDNAEPDFVSLRLGRYTGHTSGEETGKNAFNHKDHDTLHMNLALGLGFAEDTFYSELRGNLNSRSDLIRTEKGDNTEKKEENGSLKTPRSGEDDKFPQNPRKKAKVAVRIPCNTPVEHQQKLFPAQVTGIEDEDGKLNMVTLDIMKENISMETELYQGVVQGDNQTAHTRQSNQPERISATAATECTPGGNELGILPEITQTSTSPQRDQNQPNISLVAKVAETRPQVNAESDFVSLRLGRYTGNSSSEKMGKNAFDHKEHDTLHKKLALGLEFNEDTFYSELKSNLNSGSDLIRIEKGEDTKTEEENRGLKTPRSEEDDKFSQNPSKKEKVVTVRMPCNTKVIGDGCQWKKYGQKAAKGSPFPRSYYRCCVTSTCEAKKQVQICPDDLSTLITTYEGVHSHPAPVIFSDVASDPTAAIPISRCASTGSLPPHSSSPSSHTISLTTHSIPSSSQIPPSFPVWQRSLISQSTGFPSLSLPPSGKPPALSVRLPKTRFPLVQFGRLSPNIPGSPIFSPNSTTVPNFLASPIFSTTSPATGCSQLNPAATYSPTCPYIFSAGPSSAQTNISQVNRLSGSSTNRDSFSINSHVGTSHLGGLPSPEFQHQLNSYNKNSGIMETSSPERQPTQHPTSQPPINNSLASPQQMMDATTFITSHPTFQSQVAAVVSFSSLVSDNSSVVLPQSHSRGVNYSHLPVPIQFRYMPSGLGPLSISYSPLNSPPGNSLSAAPFSYHVPEAPLFPTSLNGDHKK